MTSIKINSYPLHSYTTNGLYCIGLCLATPTPSKTVEIKTVSDARVAVDAFAVELEATGKPWMVSALHDKRSGRKPNGFDKAKLDAFVNTHLAGSSV